MASYVPNPNRTLRRGESTVDRLKRQVSQGASQWLGLEKEPEVSNIWLQRRAAFHGASLVMGRGVSKKCKTKLEIPEESIPAPRDPLHRPGTAYRSGGDDVDFSRQMSRSSALTQSSMGTRRKNKKDSVARLALDGLSLALGVKAISKPRSQKFGVQSRSLPPTSLLDLAFDGSDGALEGAHAGAPILEADELDDDVFFDNKSHGTSALDLRPTEPLIVKAIAAATGRPIAAGWRDGIEKKPPIPSTPGFSYDHVDGPIRMLETVKKKVLEKPEKRRLGEGIVGRLFHRVVKGEQDLVNTTQEELKMIHDHRPFFTYWITVTQIIIYIVSVSVYGIAPIGFGKKVISHDVLVTALYPRRIGFEEPENFWIGPRQVDLIHLGAKYAPCMRKDANIDDLYSKILEKERDSACCVYDDNSGCYQSMLQDCNLLRAKWHKWNGTSRGGRKSGSVCNQDPSWCLKPRGDTWPDDITKWPICSERESGIDPSYPHMTCSVLSRPCCIGVKGECQILTEDHCQAKRGYFHPNATLCSQVKCMGKVCGLINFLDEDHPDQFYRLWISLFLHAGLFHVLLSSCFQFLIMRDMEKLAGCVRIAIIYFGAGIGGNLTSAIFLPYHVEVGPAGSQFGILSTLWVEVIQSWQLIERPGIALAKLCGFTVALFILGLLPWIDNYAHLSGFIFGLLLSFAILPYVTFGSQDKRRKLIGVILSIIGVVILYVILFVVFYVTPIRQCDGCKYLNCIPFTQDFCENMGVEIDTTETLFEWENSGE